LLTRLGLHSTYATDVLPALVLIGIGLGFVVATAINTATAGVRPADSGIASALVNTSQQIGGSVGTALLNTLATTWYSNYIFFFLRDHFSFGNRQNLWVSALYGLIYIPAAVQCGKFAQRRGFITSPERQRGECSLAGARGW